MIQMVKHMFGHWKKTTRFRRPYTTSSNFEVRYTGYTIVFYENGSYVAHIRLKSSFTMYLGVAIYTANAEVTSRSTM